MNVRISTIVVDDDPIGRLLLKTLISQHASLTFLDEAGNASDAREKILALRPDAIFLDVRMPGATGLELLRSLDFLPFVVFVTLSERGILAADADDEVVHVPTLPLRGPIDVVGAGDSVTANLTAALAAGASLREAVELAVVASSVVVHQLGTTGVATAFDLASLLNQVAPS